LTFAELDGRLGAFRLNTGVRALAAGADGRALLEPRVAARWQPTEQVALTLGWSRDHQALSALQDERTTMPGPPFYYVHPAGSPESRSDALNAEFTWWGRDWNASAGAYDRRDSGIPHWMPVRARDMSALSWDDGRVRGIELSARRFGARASGWIWYSMTDARYTNASAGSSLYAASASRYVPAATHRHAAAALWMTRLWPSTTFSAQATYGSGQYLWPPTGNFIAPRFGFGPGPVIAQAIEVAPWGTEQVLAPPTYRLDLGLRKTVAFRQWSMEPYVSVRNIGARSNLLTYDRIGSGYNGIFSLEPLGSFVKVLPTIGLDVRF
ncbi:MAG TPA: TonB-dependent receptor, partial [Gemmatimonadaceae bacterium]